MKCKTAQTGGLAKSSLVGVKVGTMHIWHNTVVFFRRVLGISRYWYIFFIFFSVPKLLVLTDCYEISSIGIIIGEQRFWACHLTFASSRFRGHIFRVFFACKQVHLRIMSYTQYRKLDRYWYDFFVFPTGQ